MRAALLAGGQGARMGSLTRQVCKPMVPFAGSCRLVDFSMANAVRSGVKEIVVLSRHLERELIDHLLRTWDGTSAISGDEHRLSIHFGPHEPLLPHGRGRRGGLPADLRLPSRPPDLGIADALLANEQWLFAPGATDLLVLHADHVYSFDYRPMLAAHRMSGAAATIGVQHVERRFVRLFGMVSVDDNYRVRQLVEKPEDPTSTLVFTAFCLFRIDALRDALALLASLPAEDWQHDISRDILPLMIASQQEVRAYPVTDYWADIGTVERYLLGHMELLSSPSTALGLADAPRTLPGADPKRLEGDRVIASDPVPVHAHVRETVLYPGCVVEAGASIERSVVLPGAKVKSGATLRDTVVLGHETVSSTRSGIAALI
ncbi:MAG TPA: sugar phosphate nucleotidyltransferase [Streptosporangiaceae bacterium]